ncbi:MAG: hypothetical protein ACP5NA_05450 [Candidatus Acidulodesulfobacterium sp.]
MKNRYIDIIISKKFIELNKLNIYILCFALILSMQFFLSGCASNSLFSNNSAYSYNNGGSGNAVNGVFLEKNEETGYNKKAEKFKEELENNVLYYSLRLNKVSGKKIKNLEYLETYRHKTGNKQTGPNNYYIKPSFMIGEYGIRNKTGQNINNNNNNTSIKTMKAQSEIFKNTAAVQLKQKEKEATPIFIKLDKTAETDGGKIALKIAGVMHEGILEIISFSLSNFNKSSLKYKPLLLKKSVKNKYIEIPFKSNIKKSRNKNYFVLSGLSRINGKLIFISRDKKSENISALHKTVLFIEALYKNDYGGLKFIKLPVRL